MKILIFAHSARFGGGESGLRCLVKLLQPEHELEIVLPSAEGSEPNFYSSMGIRCHYMRAPLSLPHFSWAALNYGRMGLEEIADKLKTRNFDASITNTAAILHGPIISHMMNIPSVIYVHEDLYDEELAPTSLTPAQYISILEDLSEEIITCSAHISKHFKTESHEEINILEPYDFDLKPLTRSFGGERESVIQLIGQQSIRKNLAFAATLAKSLEIRQNNMRLDIIGSENDGSQQLQTLMTKRKISHRILSGQHANPYEHNINSKVITLVSARSEPYGLTIPESLRRGIPVLASNSGGPSELLEPAYRYDVNDLDRCSRRAAEIFENYEQECKNAYARYSFLSGRVTTEQLRSSLKETIDSAILKYKARRRKEPLAYEIMKKLSVVYAHPIDKKTLSLNIAKACEQRKITLSVNEVSAMITEEEQKPGSAVTKDIVDFDVVPYAMSDQMNTLYSQGLGLAIELASTYTDNARQEMAAFILSSLLVNFPQTEARVLAIGDGIGIDSIRISLAGFDVDYVDHDNSLTGEIAKINFSKVSESLNTKSVPSAVQQPTGKYDAIICLEVIEHVDNPASFIEFLSSYLKEDGYLFISECFNGIESHWPTHLWSNEKYSGLLPFLLIKKFDLIDFNRRLYGKPFIFKKSDSPRGCIDELLRRQTLISLINNKLNIGV